MIKRIVMLVALSAAAPACEVTGPDHDPSIRVYDLMTIDGQPVPVQMTNARIGSGSFHINADNTFQMSYWQTNAQGGQGGLIGSEGRWVRIRNDSLELTTTLQVTFTFKVAAKMDTIWSSGWVWVRQP